MLKRRYGKEADIWSCGVILYILLSGVPPFWGETEQQIFDAVAKGHIDFKSDPWPHVSNEAKDAVRIMLQQVCDQCCIFKLKDLPNQMSSAMVCAGLSSQSTLAAALEMA